MPVDSELGLDTPLPPPPIIDWRGLGNIVPVLSEQEQQKAQAEQKKAAEGDTGDGEESESDKRATSPSPPTLSQIIEQPKDAINAWSDYALSIGAELMQKCRADVLQQLGYTCSAGVARNKVGSPPGKAKGRVATDVSSRSWQSCAVHIANQTHRLSYEMTQYRASSDLSNLPRSVLWEGSSVERSPWNSMLRRLAICGKSKIG